MRQIIYTLLFILCSCAAGFGQTEPAAVPAIEDAYLARDNGEGKAGEQVTEFRTTDIPIYCVILLDSSAATVVKMNFVAVSVPGVKPETKVVSAAYTTKDGQNRVNFTGRPDGKWIAGKYRVDVFVDGRIARALELDIKGSAPAVKSNSAKSATSASLVTPPPKPKPAKPRQ